ncbi:hypothetical protein GCM10010449_06520 [Streptomyces rectiviolaceus]|uniref:Secreted protein n=2 Tax=Streptomyces rectiviolaceus TaxID=332591 RepID=A0ABP6M754_9ACTN
MAQSGRFKRVLVASGAAALLSLSAAAPSALADARQGHKSESQSAPSLLSGTKDGWRWYIGGGNSYGAVDWDDNYKSIDRDNLILNDDIFPSGYSVKMTVTQGDDFKKTVHAYGGDAKTVHIPLFSKGEKAKFKACAWNNNHKVMCRPTTYVTE